VNLCEKASIVAPMITYAYRDHLYASLADLYGSGHLPDSICAMALACKGVGVPVVQAQDVSPSDMEAIWAQAALEESEGGMLAPPSRGDVRQWQPVWNRRRYW
jgi:hypothetical protein